MSRLKKDYHENVQQVFDRWAAYQKLPKFEEEKARAGAFERLAREWRQISKETVEQAQHQAGRSAALARSLKEGEGRFNAARDTLDALEELLIQSNQDARIDSARITAGAKRLILTTLLASLLLALIIAWGLRLSIRGPLLQVIASLRGLAEGNGDLTARLPTEGTLELRRLAQGFNAFMDKLHEMVAQIIQASSALSDSAAQLDRSAAALVSGSEQMSLETAQSAAALEEVSVNMSAMATSSEETATALTQLAGHAQEMPQDLTVVSGEARDVSEQVGIVAAAVEELSASLQEVSRNCAEAATSSAEGREAAHVAEGQMDRLGEVAREVAGVVNLINHIAEQTKLLALNATIEAASAGEAGRGFSVVANEVKALAGQTEAATKQIEGQVKQMTETTREAIAVMSDIRRQIEQISALTANIAAAVEEQSTTTDEIAANVAASHTAGENLSEHLGRLQGGINEVARGISEMDVTLTSISQATQEVDLVTGSISKSTQGLELISGETRETSTSVKEESKRISALAHRLDDLVSRFKIAP